MSVPGEATPAESIKDDESGINSGAYIDHRLHDDLAHLHSSPARSRRRSTQHLYNASYIANNLNNANNTNTNDVSVPARGGVTRRFTTDSTHSNSEIPIVTRQPSLPLTNKNLQNLLTQSNPGSSRAPKSAISPTNKSGSVALDMDRYTKEQRRLARAQTWANPFLSNQEGDDEDDEDSGHEAPFNNSGHADEYERYSEFGGSNPSSDHSSDSTSLDDVCFPDYYIHNKDDSNKESTFQWPDLKVMEEFIIEEMEEADMHFQEHSSSSESPNVTFYPVAKSSGQSKLREQTVSPNESRSDDDISPFNGEANERTPLVHNHQVNELESLDSLQDSFRIRPKAISPWDTSKEQIPPILQNQQSRSKLSTLKHKKPEGKLCRFTYFREDLEKTVHSPTISGLIAGDPLIMDENTTSLSKKWRGPDKEETDKEESLLDRADPSTGKERTIEEEEAAKYEEIMEEEEKSIYSRLQDLFQPTHYSQHLSSLPSNVSVANAAVNVTPVANPAPIITPEIVAVPSTNTLNPNTLNFQTVNKISSNKGTETPLAGTAVGSVVGNNEPPAIPFWLDVLDPTEEEMKVLSKTFGIHPLTTEDIFLGETREKVELFKSYYFICFTSFDVVYERRKQRAKEQEKKLNKLQEMYDNGNYDGEDGSSIFGGAERKSRIWKLFSSLVGKNSDKRSRAGSFVQPGTKTSTSRKSKGKKIREGELSPLNMYMIVFKDAVITFHFSATPHPINVRRRARLLRDYLTVTSDWICYALIDDITDSFAPMIDSIEEEVNSIEDAILKMHSGGDSDDDSDSDDSDADEKSEYSGPIHRGGKRRKSDEAVINSKDKDNVFIWRKRSKSTVEHGIGNRFKKVTKSNSSKSSSKSSTSASSKILGWKRKGDMLRRIGECRKRVMSVLRLLGSKADVIKGFSKRFSEAMAEGNKTSSKGEIGMYLGDIQDHIVTMVQSLNHYEKLLARFHSNYLAQINIDMTKVNNDTNDVLGKITILGTIVLPINVVTGLWGMNCLVPGQDYDSLTWFYSIVGAMCLFSILAYNYARKVTGL
ncbi:uncharacterized protein RJT20DRAFT_32452 [Scheffersomyces xylosifermentans]|uniref:uncharacterized protein n=1 Tax=Scheffersomyces xylosifermentans TaxID=1304137 RepID=UPI00315C5E02